jgi:hypothetical protein
MSLKEAKEIIEYYRRVGHTFTQYEHKDHIKLMKSIGLTSFRSWDEEKKQFISVATAEDWNKLQDAFSIVKIERYKMTKEADNTLIGFLLTCGIIFIIWFILSKI